MNKKLLTLTITIILFSAAFIQYVSSETINPPKQLKIATSPPTMPSDNSTTSCISIQLQDADGRPARAERDTTISLSSSITEIGTAAPTVTIKTGETYAQANFSSTFTPGTTTITAAASGYETVQAAITTVGPKPYTVAVYGFPATLLADGQTYQAIMVQLQDSTGSPAKAPNGGTEVTLSCSNVTVGDVTPNVTIGEGETYAIANFTTTPNFGETVITPVASDYTSKPNTITTEEITPCEQLTISTGPQKVLADNIAYPQIAVQIKNDAGQLGVAAVDLAVTIASNDRSIGTTEQQIIIPAGHNYALATFSSTYKAGSAIITAAATGYTAASQTITTTGYTASKLAVYCVPSSLPADNGVYQTVQVQLQDSQGRPAKAPSDLTVSLFSSQPSVAAVSSSVEISMGQTCTTGTLSTTKIGGIAAITAQASSYVTTQVNMEASKIDKSPLTVAVTANPANVFYRNQSEVTAYVSADGNPVSGATVQFTSNSNGTFSDVNEDGAGYYKATFTAPNASAVSSITITANVSKQDCISTTGTARVTVTASPVVISNSTASNLTASSMVMRIIDGNGAAVSGAQVSSLTQPAGLRQLMGTTNGTGYVKFSNVKSGYYMFDISKEGYTSLSQSISFNGNLVVFMLSAAPADNTLLIIAAVAVVIVLVVVAVVVVKRRRTSSKSIEPLTWPMPQ